LVAQKETLNVGSKNSTRLGGAVFAATPYGVVN
jgi:hypothetical protein